VNFTQLKVWQKARELRNKVFTISRGFPPEERYNLTSQLLSSSRSVTDNIAEGHGHYHRKENLGYCRMARASLSETLCHLICACDCHYVQKEDLEKLKNEIKDNERILNGHMWHLGKQKNV
jgi:four helix bundle protein